MTATERAYAYTKSRVLDATFAGGDLITEGEVAEALAMSRTPVREAFLRLQGEGFLRLYPKRGALVVPVSAAEVEAVMETRLLVERFALEKLLVRGPAPKVAAQMLSSIARQQEAAAAGDTYAFVDHDRRFHTSFVTAAGNPIVASLYETLRDRQQRMVVTSLLRRAERVTAILDEHRLIADAVHDGAVENATSALTAHLNGTLDLLRAG
jgi:DNA-binding GntR family transcriptional regulator